MKPKTKRMLVWTPRILGILFAAFVSLFSLDVFVAGITVWQAIGALLIHLTPVYALAIGVWLGWRREWVGAVAFAGFALWYLIISLGNFDPIGMLIMAGVPFLIALLYLFDWYYRKELQSDLESNLHLV